jgi:hypothetical protein
VNTRDDAPTRLVNTPANNQGKNLFEDITPPKEPESFRQKTVAYAAPELPADAGKDMTRLASFDQSGTGGFKDFMNDPVAGWVVIIRGAGKGTSLPLGYGSNAIGRASSQRVRLDFGDTQISRENHAVITYEPRGRVFYLQNGSGINLTYLEEGDSAIPVLAPVVLASGQCIQLGSTTLKFMALCGNDFDWQALAE